MALHSASDFLFTTGDLLSAIKYPADGATRPALPDSALCGYDLAYLMESILWRSGNNWNANRSYTVSDSLFRTPCVVNLSYIGNRLVSLGTMLSSAPTEMRVAKSDEVSDFETVYSDLVVNPATLPYKSATKPSSGDPLTRTYLAALEDSLAAFNSVVYTGRMNAYESALKVTSATGSYDEDDYDFYVKSGTGYLGGNFGYVSWCRGHGEASTKAATDGTVKIGLADSVIVSSITASSAEPPISTITEVIPFKVWNRVYKVKFDGGTYTTVADVEQTFYFFLPVKYVYEAVSPGASKKYVLKLDGSLSLSAICSRFNIEIVDVAEGVKQNKYAYTGFQVVSITPGQLSDTVVTFKDL